MKFASQQEPHLKRTRGKNQEKNEVPCFPRLHCVVLGKGCTIMTVFKRRKQEWKIADTWEETVKGAHLVGSSSLFN